MRKAKKWLALFLTLAMVLSLVPAAAFAAEDDSATVPVETVTPDTETETGEAEDPADIETPAETEDPAETEEPVDTEEPAETEDPALELLPDGESLAENEIAFTDWSQVAQSSWYTGNEEEYTIMTAEQLAGLALLVNYGNSFEGITIKLGSDVIDLSAYNWTPIGNADYPFAGIFDGCGNAIIGLNCTVDETDFAANKQVVAGLFGCINSTATVGNLDLTITTLSATRNAGNSAVTSGGVAAYIKSSGTAPEEGTIHDCHVILNGSISTVLKAGTHEASGVIVGENRSGKIVDCSAEVPEGSTITDEGMATAISGVLVGFMSGGSMSGCSAVLAGEVKATANSTGNANVHVGGAVGWYNAAATMTNCVVNIADTGKLTAVGSAASHYTNVGGLVGLVDANSNISNVCVINQGTLTTQNPADTDASRINVHLLLGRRSGGTTTVTNASVYSSTELGSLPADVDATGVTTVTDAEALGTVDAYPVLNFAYDWGFEGGVPVLGKDATSATTAAFIAGQLTYKNIRGTNAMPEGDAVPVVTSNLDLRTRTAHGASIAWTIDDTAIAANGTVIRTEQEKTVTLTATVTKGGQTVNAAAITVTVPAIEGEELNEWSAFADTSWYNTMDTAFTLTTAAELAGLAKLVNNGTDTFLGKTITLGNDIDLAGKNWTPIGQGSGEFQGTFDGGDHAIQNLQIDVPAATVTSFVALFGKLSVDAVIRNLTLTVEHVIVGSTTSEVNAAALSCSWSSAKDTRPEEPNIHDVKVILPEGKEIKATTTANANARAAGVMGFSGNTALVTMERVSLEIAENATITAVADNNNSVVAGIAARAYCSLKDCSVKLDGTIGTPTTSLNKNVYVSGLIALTSSTCPVVNCVVEIGETGKISTQAADPAGARTATEFLSGLVNGDGALDGCIMINNGTIAHSARTPVAGNTGLLVGGNARVVNSYAYAGTCDFALGNFNTCAKLESAADITDPTKCPNLNYLNWFTKDNKIMLAYTAKDAGATDQELVNYVQSILSFNNIKGENTSSSLVRSNLELLTETKHGVSISWSSNQPNSISNEGVVTMGDAAQSVTLTATLTKGEATATKAITVNVPSGEGQPWQYFADTSWYNDTDVIFTINTREELAGLAVLSQTNNFIDKTIQLGADIDLGGRNWLPIGNASNANYAFAGTFDGQNHTISNLECVMSGDGDQRVGLFSSVNTGGTVLNLKLTVKNLEAHVLSSRGHAGAGAIVGETVENHGMTIRNCTVTVLAGGKIVADSNADHAGAGAMAGITWNNTLIEDSFVILQSGASISNTVDNAEGQAGGYIGFAKSSTIQRCSVQLDGEISSTATKGEANNSGHTYTGGFIGVSNSSKIKDSYAIIGSNGKLTAVKNSNTGSIPRAFVGAFIGGVINKSATTTIETSYVINRGTMSITDDKAGAQPGALLGYYDGNTTFNNVYYYNSSETEYPVAGYRQSGTVTNNGSKAIGLDEIGVQETYDGFDFATIWYMNTTNGYPMIGTELDLPDTEIVNRVKGNLSFDTIKGNNEDQNAITTKLVLPTEGLKNSTIRWTSNNTSVINSSGRVIRPEEDTQVQLTAHISSGAASAIWTITLTVKAAVTQVTDTFWRDFWAQYWNDPAHDDAVWVTVGDSITCAANSHGKGEKYYYEHLYAQLNGEMNKNVTFVVPGVSGWRASHFNENYVNWVEPYNPDIVTIYFGMNDRSTELDTATRNLKELVEKILPDEVNENTPANERGPVVVLVACNPVGDRWGGTDQEGIMREFHAYGEQLAQEKTSGGYYVQYVDLYSYYRSVEGGVDGNLAEMSDYFNDALHPNQFGHYLTAQCLMKNMGMYSTSSVTANLEHDKLSSIDVTKPTPAATVQYNQAKFDLNGNALTGAKVNSPGYEAVRNNNNYQTMLVMGGAATAGDNLSTDTYRTYAWHLEAHTRWEAGKNYTHIIPVAGEDHDVNWFNTNFSKLMERFNTNPGSETNRCTFIMYMPEVNELYGDNYTHSQAKVTAYQTALEAFVDKCESANIELTLVTPFPMQDSEKDGYLRQYVQAIINVAQTKNVSLCNLYRVFTETAKTYPHIMRNWYTEDGMPNFIAHMEAAKTFLIGTYGTMKDNGADSLARLVYRKTATNGTQYDYAGPTLKVTRSSSSSSVDLSGLFGEALYTNVRGVTLRNTRGATVPSTWDANTKTLTFTTPASYDDLEMVIAATATNIVPLKGIEVAGTTRLVINLPVVGDETLAAAGGVAVTLVDGSALTQNADKSYSVPDGAMVRLTAQPADGYAFDHWEMVNAAAAQLLSVRAAALDLTRNPLELTVEQASTVTPVFKKVAMVEEGDPMLAQLYVGVPEISTSTIIGRTLIRDDLMDKDYNTFAKNVKDYTLYLLPGETEVNFAAFGEGQYKLSWKVGSGNATEPTALDMEQPVEVNVPNVLNDTTVVLTVTNEAGDKSTDYTISIVRKSAAPQMMLELEGNAENKATMMDLYIKDAEFMTGSFTIKVDGTTFAGLADLQGNLLDNATADIADVFDMLRTDIEVVGYTVNNGAITVKLASTSNRPVPFNGEGAMVARFNLKHGSAYGNTATMTDTITVEANGENVMTDFLLNNLTYKEDLQEAERLVYVKLVDTYRVSGFVNGRPDYTKMRFTVYDSSNKPVNSQPVALSQYSRIVYNLPSGTYTVRVTSDGYLTASSATFTVANGVLYLDTITMYAGDVNNDGKIDAQDRTALIEALGGEAQDKFDLNDDNKINALDLGAMLRNIGMSRTV